MKGQCNPGFGQDKNRKPKTRVRDRSEKPAGRAGSRLFWVGSFAFRTGRGFAAESPTATSGAGTPKLITLKMWF
jgi:hypothetical protein